MPSLHCRRFDLQFRLRNMQMKTRLLYTMPVVLLIASLCARAQCENPVLMGMNPDPSILRVGHDYYLVTSSFEYFPSCPIYHSLDLVHWQRVGYALSRRSQFAQLSAHPSTYAARVLGGRLRPTL